MPHRLQQSRPHVAERGVYEHPFIGPDGERYIFAVDSHGRRVLEATVFPCCADPSLVTTFVRNALDQLDPQYLKLLP